MPRIWKARQMAIDCQCIGHLKRIHGAKEQWALEFKRPSDTVAWQPLAAVTTALNRTPTAC